MEISQGKNVRTVEKFITGIFIVKNLIYILKAKDQFLNKHQEYVQ